MGGVWKDGILIWHGLTQLSSFCSHLGVPIMGFFGCYITQAFPRTSCGTHVHCCKMWGDGVVISLID